MSFTLEDLDKDSRPKTHKEELEHYKFLKTILDKVAVRIGNEQGSPLYTQQVTAGDIGLDLFEFNEDAAVELDDLTPLVSYTVPVGKVFYLDHIEASGESFAKFTVKIDGNENKVKRSSWGDGFNVDFNYNSFKVTEGKVILLEVLNCGDDTAPFEGTIEGRLSNE